MPFFAFFAAVVLVLLLSSWWLQRGRLRTARREAFIRDYTFPKGLVERLNKRRPGVAPKDAQLVLRALRHFFLAHLKSGRQFVSMPSQVTDDLWHEFILYTRHYEQFCQQAFGRFMHHTPAVVLSTEKRDNSGLRRTWWQCCKEESINPRQPSRLPLLFAIDSKLGIADGFHYKADCSGLRAKGDGSVYCGGDFSSSSVDGSTDGFGDNTSSTSSSLSDGSASSDSSSSSDSSGSSSSDSGGSGCGGGGCGGGGGGD